MTKSAAALFLVCSLCLACGGKRPVHEREKYFNAGEFIKRAGGRLRAEKRGAVKTVQVNGKRESITFKQVNWPAELKVFEDTNLDKTAYYGNYATRTTGNTEYYTLKPGFDAPVKHLSITRDDKGQPVKLMFDMSTENYVYSTREAGEFYADSLIRVVKHEKMKFMPERVFSAVWQLLK